jgi:isopenicillin N synthase-like dioxygenase
MKDDPIPTIDVSLLHGSPAERRRCAEQIGWACHEVGFFRIVNHGVSRELLHRTFAVAERFFAQPLTEKMKVALDSSSDYHGYFSVLGEVTDPKMGADPKEGYDIAFDSEGDGMTNRWPDQPADLRPTMTAYYEAVAELGRALSRGFALALALPEEYFANKLDHPTAILRLLHYPPVDVVLDSDDLPPGCGAHSDYGYLTILAQDDQGALQVQSLAGEWQPVRPVDGTFVCNIGEMMARWTNDRFRATTHRVIRVAPGSRYSIPFFFHPNPDVLIETLPTCLNEGAQRYSAITSGDYLRRRQEMAYTPGNAGAQNG